MSELFNVRISIANLFLLVLGICSNVESNSKINVPTIVKTKYGLVEGTFDGISRNGRRFFQFRGIQYAIIKDRFMASMEPPGWSSVKPAKSFGRRCDRGSSNDTHDFQTENCLYLNVYSPVINIANISALLPVVVYFHGGSFIFNSGEDYGPNYLLDEELILVTVNYRLGILGFLSTEDEESPGNYGLKDQVMALKWLKDNILGFGGDPDKITIMGQSAGSASVTYHLVSPISKGLFHHAIAESGTFLDPWAFTRKPFRHAKRLAEVLKCPDTGTSAAIVSCLRAAPASTLIGGQFARNIGRKFFEDPLTPFGPVIEPSSTVNPFLPSSPYELLKSGKVSKVPLLSGIVKEDGNYLWAGYLLFLDHPLAKEARKLLEDHWDSVASSAFYFDEVADPKTLANISKKLEEFYFGGKFSLNNTDTFAQLAHLYSDRLFLTSAIRFLNLYSKHSNVYPYLYTFNKYVGLEWNFAELHNKYKLDATHGAELDMLFSPLLGKVRNGTDHPGHDEMSRNMVRLWASFIKTGVPSSTYGSAKHFPLLDPNEGLKRWYRLDSDTEIAKNELTKRCAFWESLNLSDNDFQHCFCK